MKVRVYGHVGQSTGYGRACRDLCMALLASGMELEIRPLGAPSTNEIADSFGAYPALHNKVKPDEMLARPDAVIVHTLPMDCRRVMDLAIDDEHTRGFDVVDVPWIAYTTWEALTPVPPAMRESLSPFSQIWAPSTVTAKAFYSGETPEHMGDVPVRCIPHAFGTDDLEFREGDRLAADGPWSFYYVGAWSSRKNPAAILRAWAMAFEPSDHVKLYMHCPGASEEAFAVALHQTGLMPAQMAPVVKGSLFGRHARIDNDTVRTVHAEMDVFVSATRGEAWNLPAFDAMIARRHIIHTAGTGADHFLRATSAALVPGFPVPASADVRVTRSDAKGAQLEVLNPQGLSSRSTWIEPDIVRIASAMRDAYVNRTRDLSLLYSPAERFSYEAVGKLARTALEDACDNRESR